MTKETNKGSARVERVINASADEIWALVTNGNSAPALLGDGAAAKIDKNNDIPCSATGKLRVDGQVFSLKMRPYDLLAANEQGRMALRLIKIDDSNTRVIAAVACAAGITGPGKADISRFLDRLEKLATGSVPQKAAPASSKAATPGRSNVEVSQTPKKRSAKRGMGVLAVLLVVAAVVIGALFIINPFKKTSTHSEDISGAGDLSASVSEAAAQTLKERFAQGITRSEVEDLLGTKGMRVDDGTLYRSSTINGQGQPTIQIMARYDGSTLSSYTYLNLDNAKQIGSVDVNGDINSYPISMERHYFNENGESISETHVGYVDPFANFSASWRGELARTVNDTTGESTMRRLKGYDGSDPLMTGTLEGHAVANQYDDYDTFLADKLEADTALLMLNGYSHGDVAQIFGAYESYDAGSGIQLCRLRSGRAGADGEPVYTYSFKFDTIGAFDQSSFANTYLFDKTGTLAGCKPDAASAGQSYGEIRYLMPIVPTAIYVTQSRLTICYGRYIGGTDLAYQFELVAVFNRETMIAESVYNNSISDTSSEN